MLRWSYQPYFTNQEKNEGKIMVGIQLGPSYSLQTEFAKISD